MFIFFPIGVEEASVNRVPVVSIGVAAACALAFVATWIVPANPEGVRPSTLQQVVKYWSEHPYLEAPEEFRREFLNAADLEELGQLRKEAEENRHVPDEEERRIEQAKLNVLANAAVSELNSSSLRKWSLIPARGGAQAGWFTHMFLHFGWMHILGNLFFFYLVGPLLEDVWGRIVFGAFYVLGGLFAAFAHYLLEPGSHVMMAGASGAIAACIGAFALRYAFRRIRIAYLVWYGFRIYRGVWRVPAWLWGGFWFVGELWDFYLSRGHNGVAVMAHLGGFGFGFALALVLKVSGVEERFLSPSVEGTHTWQQHPALQLAFEAAERGDLDAAAASFNEVLAQEPENADAQFGLAKLELAKGDAGGHARLARLFSKLTAKGNTPEVSRMVRELGPAFDAAQLPPPVAFKVATALDESPEDQAMAEPFFARAGAAGGLLGAKAWLRAAQLKLDAGGQPAEVMERVNRARAASELPEALSARAAELSAAAERMQNASALETVARDNRALDLVEDETSLPPALGPQAPKIYTCRLEALGEAGLAVVNEQGKRKELTYTEILAIGVGAVATAGADGTSRNVVFTDLVVSWGESGAAATALRLSSNALGLGKLYPGVAPLKAYQQLLSVLFERSGASPLVDADALRRGEFPRFSDLSELERRCYGVAASA